MKSRQLVFEPSLNVRLGVQQIALSQFRLSLISAICFLALVGDLVAQRPILAPGSRNSPPAIEQTIQPSLAVVPAPVIAQPIINRQSNQQNLISGTVNSAVNSDNALIANPENDPLPVASQPSVEARQIADEINSIRRQLGGGLSQHLGKITNENSQFEESFEASFQNEITRLAGQPNRESLRQTERPTESQPDHWPRQADTLRENPEQTTGLYRQPWSSNSIVPIQPPHQPPFQSNRSQFNGSHGYVAQVLKPCSAPPLGNPSAVGRVSNPADQLRGAARTLDQLASQFETSGMYEEADQVRAQAQKFWLKSISFQNNSTGR